MERLVRLGQGFEMPVDELVVRRTAILAKTGAGKSNTAKVIVEAVLGFGAQVVILDPVGHWWGLRSLFSIPVLGGASGDIPLDPLAGKLIARAVVESGQSMVLDVSGMDSDGEMQRFVKDFAKALYDLKQGSPTAMLLVLEEADEFAPQDTRGANVAVMVGAITRIAKRGRGRGIGLMSISLRSAVLSKNVLNQTDTLIVMQTTAPLDNKAIKEWLEYVQLADAPAILMTLPGLPQGTAWFVAPALGIVREVKIVKARSLDTSATPKVGDVPVDLRTKLKPINLDQLGAEMTKYAEETRRDDPAALRREVAELRKQLAERPATSGDPVRVEVPVEVEVEVVRTVTVEVVPEAVFGLLGRVAGRMGEIARDVEEEIERLRTVGATTTESVDRPSPRPTAPAAKPPVAPPVAPRPPAPRSDPPADGSLTGPQQRILDGLAWWAALGVLEPSLTQLGFLAGYHPRSKGFTNALGTLSSGGMIERLPGQAARMTDAGARHARVPDSTPTDSALHEMIYAQLRPNAARMLRALIETYGRGEVAVDAFAEQMGYHPRSKGFTNVVGSLSGLGLLDRGKGTLRASRLCFVG